MNFHGRNGVWGCMSSDDTYSVQIVEIMVRASPKLGQLS
jgi:hypothetical protein